MQIYKDLTTVYKDSFFQECHDGDTLQIKEREPEAKVQLAEIPVQSDITQIDESFLHKSTTWYYKDNTGRPQVQHDCDGILLIDYNNKEYLVLVELKSQYTKNNIEKAELQLAASYFRIASRLSLFKNFNLHRQKVCGIIVSLPYDTDKKLKTLRKKKTGKPLCRFEQQALYFIDGDRPYLLDDTHVKLAQLPICTYYYQPQLSLFHVDATPGTTRFDLYKYLRKL